MLLTRAAMDELLNELQFAREKQAAAERALEAAKEVIETRDSLEELISQQSKSKWYVPFLAGAGSFVGGYLAGQSQQDTVIIR